MQDDTRKMNTNDAKRMGMMRNGVGGKEEEREMEGTMNDGEDEDNEE